MDSPGSVVQQLPGTPTTSTSTPAATSLPSNVFIKIALEQLSLSKEIKKFVNLKDAIKPAQDALDAAVPDISTLQTLFHPLKLACQSRQPSLVSIAIDCLGKLFSYNYWNHPAFQQASGSSEPVVKVSTGEMEDADTLNSIPLNGNDQPSETNSNRESIETGIGTGGSGGGGMIADVVDTICDTFAMGENTDEKVQLQIVKALLAAVSASTIKPSHSTAIQPILPKGHAMTAAAIHGGTLLRAIRTTYNVFLLSKNSNTQIVAQASLTQMVQGVMNRIPKILALPVSATTGDALTAAMSGGGEESSKDTTSNSATDASSVTPPVSADGPEKVLLRRDSMPRRADLRKSEDILSENRSPHEESELDLCMQDAYLVFRALCKLSMKPIPTNEGPTDLKSHSMRSKLLSLHLVHSILTTHSNIFVTPAPSLFSLDDSLGPVPPVSILFIHSIKQYLCLTLSRNALSVVPQVFDLSLDIFGRVLVDFRSVLKRELSVIFTELIIPLIEARSSVTFHQRTSLMKSLYRLLSDPNSDSGRILVEIYLNYDCDVEVTSARENIWERLINSMGKTMTLFHAPDDKSGNSSSSISSLNYARANQGSDSNSHLASSAIAIPPAITTANLTSFTREQVKELYSSTGDYGELKKRGLEVLVRGVLRQLVAWCVSRADSQTLQWWSTVISSTPIGVVEASSETAEGGGVERIGLIKDEERPRVVDDPTQFETQRQRKQVLLEGITRFNQKPKKGIQFMLEAGCIPSRTKRDIALFLLNTDGLSKKMIGEFLGEGDEDNIAIMHAFVEEMNFENTEFVDAIRNFLQHFRLPGEAQKIDRFMLKFAERYHQSNPGKFATADTAYVLAYSVIMLNSDQHNPQVKKRMTKADFLKNNSGIDEGKNLPVELLEAIFDEIQSNEIILHEEHADKPKQTNRGSTTTLSSLGGLPGIAAIPGLPGLPGMGVSGSAQYNMASESVAMKTEALFNNIMRSGKRTTATPGADDLHASGTASVPAPANSSEAGSLIAPFFGASHFEHVKPMFQTVWMSILTALSTALQESEDTDSVAVALEGFKHAIWISCLFDLELERKAFISTLGKFTHLSNAAEMKQKNLEAVKTLIEIGQTLGNRLNDSWMDVVVCVSQLEKLQIVDSNSGKTRSSTDLRKRDGQQSTKKDAKAINDELIAVASSQTMTLMVDKIFTVSVRFSGSSIVEFVRALCTVSSEEIQSSASSEHPRMYCLQRLVEISYYNMKRIRVEWSNIWAILGNHFNYVGSHSNPKVCFFALDKLRQLAMKFLELEELASFKFQKDFLKPFEFVMAHNHDSNVKDMALTCLQQMIHARAKSFKSGWKAVFGALTWAAKEDKENLVVLAFEIAKTAFKNDFESVVANFTFNDCITCLVEFCKNRTFAKLSLQAVELLKQAVPRLLEMSKTSSGSKALMTTAPAAEKTANELLAVSGTPHLKMEKSQSFVISEDNPQSFEEAQFRFLFPILFGLYEVIMTGDLEVRTRGLTYLFDTLKQQGPTFSADSWEVVSKGVLFPIFDDLRLSRQEHTKFANKEDFSVWLSTTLIQALRLLIDLFSEFFNQLQPFLDGMFDLLIVCMTQENETLARIGSTCIQQFVEINCAKLDNELWQKTGFVFKRLFDMTAPEGLFFDYRFEIIPEAPAGIIAPEESGPPDDMTTPTIGGPPAVADPPASPQSPAYIPPQQPENDDVAVGGGKAKVAQLAQVSMANETLLDDPSALLPLVFDNNGSPVLIGRRNPEKSEFQGIIVKCVLHLLVIQTLQEVLMLDPTGSSSDAVYNSTPSETLFLLLDCLERSYLIAKSFNRDMDLRVALYRMGFMKQLPNLLKQETSSVAIYLSILVKMYTDESPARKSCRDRVESKLIGLSHEILEYFVNLEGDAKKRNVAAWRPAVITVLSALGDLDDTRFKILVPQFYGSVIRLVLQPDLGVEIRGVLFALLSRCGVVFGITSGGIAMIE